MTPRRMMTLALTGWMMMAPACGDSASSSSDAEPSNNDLLDPSDGQGGEATGDDLETDEDTPDADAEREALVDKLGAWLSGSFDSSAQASSDPAYFDISLEVCPAEAPELGTRVLYVEQAVTGRESEPYRQRLYVLSTQDERFVSSVYELDAPEAAIGTCGQGEPARFGAEEVSLRDGCAVYLEWREDHFVGGTEGTDCASTLQGASYATSQVELYDDRVESWDRGYDTLGAQVWGAVAGPYRFGRKP